MARGLKRSALLATVAAALARPARGVAQSPIPVRFAVIGSSGQAEVPNAVTEFRLDRKYGLALEVVDFAVPGQQYMMHRSGAADVSAGNFVDLMRQRKAGVALQSFHGFQGYCNLIVAKPSSPIKTFADLKGKRVGEFGTTFLDWLILRAAGKRAYGFDLEHDATPVQGAPPLLNQFLERDEVDATLQFVTLTLGPIAQGHERVVSEMPALMRAAGFDPNCFYVLWFVGETWTSAHPGAVDRLGAMLTEAYAKLRGDDGLWPTLAEKIHITDPALVAAYRTVGRKIDDPPYRAGLLAPTQKLLDAIVTIAGEDAVGVTALDPAAFLFPRGGRR